MITASAVFSFYGVNMSAGTLTLTNNSALVGGSGTAFATELAAGDFIVATVGGIAYTLPVKSLESATSLTLISNYPGPTQSGIAWSAVPRAAQNQITAAVVAQTTEALRSLNSDKRNWQSVFSESGDITVILPDGSSFTGPSWKKISDILADIDPVGLQQIADQVAAHAQQVATDRQDVDARASQVSGDASTASQAATDASAANTTAQQAKTDAVAANTAAQQAKLDAQAAAASIDTTNLLNKNNNLSELTDKTASRANLSVYSKSEIDTKLAAAWGTWLSSTDPLVTEYLLFPNITNLSAGEIFVRFLPNSIELQGVWRKAFVNGSSVLALQKLLPGFTLAVIPFTVVAISQTQSSFVAGNNGTGTATSTLPNVVACGQTVNSGYVIGTIRILFM